MNFGEDHGSKREASLSYLTDEKRRAPPKDTLKMQSIFCSTVIMYIG